MAIAYATLDYILQHIRCRTLFATHYHELARMLGAGPSGEEATLRPGVSFFCTDVDDVDGGFAYAYRLRPGINYDSHAIMAAQIAGMPAGFLETAQATLDALDGGASAGPSGVKGVSRPEGGGGDSVGEQSDGSERSHG